MLEGGGWDGVAIGGRVPETDPGVELTSTVSRVLEAFPQSQKSENGHQW